MESGVTNKNFSTDEGIADGGQSYGIGFCIAWQRGPINEPEGERNGAFIEDVLQAVKSRIEYHQSGPFACDENKMALSHINLALEQLSVRTQSRKARGVEGTTKP